MGRAGPQGIAFAYGAARVTVVSEVLGRAGTVDQVACRRVIEDFTTQLAHLEPAAHSGREAVKTLDDSLAWAPRQLATLGRLVADRKRPHASHEQRWPA